ncbi:methionyl-tRNA formyltransferase [Thalassiella azotivora]
MRLVFAGTPEAAVPSLRALLDSDHDVVAVLTRPDARSGRGRRAAVSPVKQVAQEHGLEVLQPASTRDPALRERLQELAPDCCPVVAYGGLVPASLLVVPAHGWVNLHFSLLPAWRGAAPVQHAVIAGDEVTGATTFALEEGLDTGPVYGRLTEPVRPRDTAGDLLERLSVAGAGLLRATVDGLAAGALDAVPQPAEGVTLAPKLTPEDASVRWGDPALAVDRRVRGCTPAPGAWTWWRGERLKLGPLAPAAGGGGGADGVSGTLPDLAPGELAVRRSDVLVGTGSTPVVLGDVRPAGRRMMPAADWARGVRPQAGERLGEEP